MRFYFALVLCLALLAGCQPIEQAAISQADTAKRPTADVTAVSMTGAENAYQFQVTISSPDTGCDQYADWWEVLDLAGNLLYRRILAHSHVEEQPFTRSGGPVAISKTQSVLVRAHLNTGGYGTTFIGSATDPFTLTTDYVGFATETEHTGPLPGNCAS